MDEYLPEGLDCATLFSCLNEGLILLDAQGQIIGWTRPAYRFLEGAGRVDTPLGRQLHELLHLDGERLQVEAGRRQTGQLPLPGGEFQGVELHYVKISAHHLAVVLTPISQLERRFEQCLSFFSALQHNLRNPMATVRMLSQALDLEFRQLGVGDEVKGVAQTYMDRMSKEIGRMATMLTFSRHLRPPTSTGWSMVDPARLLRQSLDGKRAALRRNGVDIQADLQGGGHAWVESVALHQVLNNLLSILSEGLSGAGSRLGLTERNRDGEIHLHFTTTAPSFLALDLERSLGANPLPPHELKGNNLGLLISRWLLEQAGAKLEPGPEGQGVILRFEARDLQK